MGNYVNSFKQAIDLESVEISKMMLPSTMPILALRKNLVPYILKCPKPTVYVYLLFLGQRTCINNMLCYFFCMSERTVFIN